MKKLLHFLTAVCALAAALVGLLLIYDEKTKDDDYLTLYDDAHPRHTEK